MIIFQTALKSLFYRPLSTFLSVLLLSFGLGLIMVLLEARDRFEESFKRNIQGIDLVVGAKGSPLQLILSGVYHIDAPTGNISLAEFEKLQKNPQVKQAIPLSLGDNYRGYRIVGTNADYPALYQAEMEQGRAFEKPLEAVIGARVAAQTGLKVGDQFAGNHGLQAESEDSHEHQAYTVTGIMQANGSVLDQLILTPLESVWLVHHHPDPEHDQDHTDDHGHHDHDDHPQVGPEHAQGHTQEHDHGHAHPLPPYEEREITIGLLRFSNPMATLRLPRQINQQTNMQAALPAIEINRLFSLADNAIDFLQALGLLLLLLAGISVFTALLQSLKDEEAQLAFLRALGSPRRAIFGFILSKGLLLSSAGFLGALVLSQLALWGIHRQVSANYQYQWEQQLLSPHLLSLLAVVLILGFAAALLPAFRAYRLNISKTLSDA